MVVEYKNLILSTELNRATVMQMFYLDNQYYHHLLRMRVLKKSKWHLFPAEMMSVSLILYHSHQSLRLYGLLIGSDRDAMNYAQSCPQCAISQGAGSKQKPPLHLIPTEHPFQIVGVDVMELLITTRGNKYVVVFQDLFIKWPMVYPTLIDSSMDCLSIG